MSFKTTWRLFVLVVLLGGTLWVLNYAVPSSQERMDAEASVLPPFKYEINRLEIVRDKWRVAVERDAEGWQVVYPLRVRADDGVVQRILAHLEALPRLDTITAEQMLSRELSWNDYGLDAPAVRVYVVSADMNFSMALGNASPFGEQLFVRCDNDENVVATDAKLLDVLPETLHQIINRRVFNTAPHEWIRLEIQRENAPFLQLGREVTGWRLLQPVQAAADKQATELLLERLQKLEIVDYVRAGKAAQIDPDGAGFGAANDLESYGLSGDEDVSMLRIWSVGDDLPSELRVGRAMSSDTNFIYAMLSGEEAVFTIPAEIHGIMTTSSVELREREFFKHSASSVSNVVLQAGDIRITLQRTPTGKWAMKVPHADSADAEFVNGLLDEILRLSALDFIEPESVMNESKEMKEPWLDVVFSGSSDNNAANNYTNHIILGMPGTNNVCVALLPEREMAAKVDAREIKSYIQDSPNPLIFLDRTILSLDPQHVTRISLFREEALYTMIRGDDDIWLTGDGKQAADAELLDELLFFAAHVRADEIIALQAPEMDQYGLGVDAFHIAYGLIGEQGIQKIIYIGRLTGDGDGYFARLKGRDVVFVLDAELVQRVTGGFFPRSEK